jgi:hypothetical protein
MGCAAARPKSLFTCWTAPLRVVATGDPVSNPDRQVCQDDQVAASAAADSKGAVKVKATGVKGSTIRKAGAAAALRTEATSTTESAVAQSSADAATLTVGSTVIDLGAMTSQTTISCTYGPAGARFSFSSRSSVSSLKINGKPVTMKNGPMEVKLAGGGSLMLNHSKTSALGVTHHAVMLHAAGADVVIGESATAISSAAGNPCRP